MKVKLILIGLAFFIVTLFSMNIPVMAAESSSVESYQQDIMYEYQTRIYTWTYEFTTDGSYYLIFINDYQNSGHLYWYNPSNGTLRKGEDKPAGCTFKFISCTVKSEYGTSNEPVGNDVALSGGYPLSTILGGSLTSFSTYDIANFHSNYVSGVIKPVSGYDYWKKGNRYDYDSVYSPEVFAPEVRYTILHWDDWSDYTDFLITIDFLVPGASTVEDYYTEIWADVPVGRDTVGNVLYEKKFIKAFKTSDLYFDNIVMIPNPNGSGWIEERHGYYYHIYKNWNELFPFLTATEMNKYGEVTFYVRNAKYTSGIALVSDYCYFTFDTADTYLDEDEKIIRPSHPDVFKGTANTFDENDVGNHDPMNPEIDNNWNTDYVGGVTDKPSTPNNTNTSKYKYKYTGDWTIADFEEWVSSGFGLIGENGILTIIGDVFHFLPSEFMHFLFWLVCIIGIVAVIRLF